MQDKEYDGTNAAMVLTPLCRRQDPRATHVDLTGGTATFADKNFGLNKTVTFTGVTLSGGDAGNYNLTSVNTTTAAITKAPLDFSAVSDTKVYDGTTTSSGMPTVSGLKGTDTVTDKVRSSSPRTSLEPTAARWK